MNSVVKPTIPTSLPPMLQQYVEYKEKYEDCLMLFQVGDFYELFFEDAKIVARTLNLTLTSRDKNSDNPIPMCGVPISVVDAYAARLVAAKYSVAIVSQSASVDSKGKQVITRYLERIVTPGIKILGQIDRDNGENVVASVYMQGSQDAFSREATSNEISVAFSNVQTGKISVRENINSVSLIAELSRIQPVEIILPSAIAKQKVDRRLSWVNELEMKLPYAKVKSRNFSLESDSRSGRDYAGIKGYTSLCTTAKKAVQLLVGYADETTVSTQIYISEIAPEIYSGVMAVDSTSKRNLELVQNLKDNTTEATLFDFLNFTLTAGGERFLRNSVLNPLIDIEKIKLRQELVSEFITAFELREEIRKELAMVADLERLAARAELLAILPKEVVALRESLQAGLLIKAKLLNHSKHPALLKNLLEGIEAKKELIELLEKSVLDFPEGTLNQGGIFRENYNTELDEVREIKNKGSSWIAELEASEKARTGINSLKIKYNNIIGYFIELTTANSAKAPDDFIRKQTTANTERFTTHELKAREKDLLGAESKLIELERKLFDELRKIISSYSEGIRNAGQALSQLDMYLALAECSERYDLVKPEITTDSGLTIKEGKHPVLLKILKDSYVPTNIDIQTGSKNFLLITGPNMGGKSTYLRQAALITILAQIGSNVPAKSAKIGIVDKIFARLGASDNQREGESTFMVEMREASHIIANATEKSLLLIDEIGRGTATADGLAIAQAILEWIVQKINCRTLFATHYHELTVLEADISNLANFSVGSFEKDGDVIFTHNIVQGPASSSYGLEVAKLAGLPAALITRARMVLSEHINNNQNSSKAGQLSFFEVLNKEDEKKDPEYEKMLTLKNKIKQIDINKLTPLESLNILSGIISEC